MNDDHRLRVTDMIGDPDLSVGSPNDIDPSETDLCTAPGAADLTFGSLLDQMIAEMFERIETLDPKGPRYCFECTICGGTDSKRKRGTRRARELVDHAPDCLLAKHLPRLKAMACKDVT